MSPFCSVETGGNHLIDMLVLVNVTTVKFCGAPLGTNINIFVQMIITYMIASPNSTNKHGQKQTYKYIRVLVSNFPL